MSTVRERIVPGDGVDLAVFERGDVTDATIVLIHGYPDTHVVWDGVADLLSSRYHVVTYDVRGAGRSGAPAGEEGYDLVHLAADVRAVVDATAGDRAVHLVGHDWGSIQGWEAVCDGGMEGRILSWTSMSAPCFDHVGDSLRPRGAGGPLHLARQAARSWYIAFFQTPALPEAAWRTLAPRLFRRYLERVEGVPTDRGYPAPTLMEDGTRGVALYRRNVRRLLRPHPRSTDLPVQVILPTRDRFVTRAAYAGIESHCTDLRWRDAFGGHWLPLTHPDRVAGWISEHAEAAEQSGTTARRPHHVAVTGGGGGIGRETAIAFASRGSHVSLVDVSPEGAERTAELCALAGGSAGVHVLDVSDVDAMESFAKTLTGEVGVPDVVVANAGIGMAGGILDTSVSDWESILGVNLWGVIHTLRLFAPAMVERGEGGHMVVIASAAAYTPSRATGAYSTTKAAASMLGQCLRAELAGDGIGVSVICPGFTDTGIATSTRHVGVSAEEQERRRGRAARLYRRRGFTPDRVARAVVAAVDGDRALVPVSTEARVLRLVSRFLPSLQRRLARIELAG